MFPDYSVTHVPDRSGAPMLDRQLRRCEGSTVGVRGREILRRCLANVEHAMMIEAIAAGLISGFLGYDLFKLYRKTRTLGFRRTRQLGKPLKAATEYVDETLDHAMAVYTGKLGRELREVRKTGSVQPPAQAEHIWAEYSADLSAFPRLFEEAAPQVLKKMVCCRR
jgi:hypothetical protein